MHAYAVLERMDDRQGRMRGMRGNELWSYFENRSIATILSPTTPFTMLYVIGLGLSDEKDITVKGLEVCML